LYFVSVLEDTLIAHRFRELHAERAVADQLAHVLEQVAFNVERQFGVVVNIHQLVVNV
jgi:hypothetical protein